MFILFQQIAYYVYNDHRREEHVLIEKWVSNEIKNQQITVNIEVPSISPTTYFSRNIIRVKYVIRVSFLFKQNYIFVLVQFICKNNIQIIGSATCCYGDPVLELPITIGTKPILDIIQQQIMESDAVEIPSIHSNRIVPQQPSAPPITLSVIPEPEQNTSLHRIIPSAPVSEGSNLISNIRNPISILSSFFFTR